MIDTSNRKIQSHYDFIVVGAGAAGSVLAAELSASGAQVLVIESGGPDDARTIANPSIWFYNVGGPLDYHLPVNPSPRLNNRTFNMALGDVLGGGSSINAMVWTRGMQRDYDGWAENGAKGWAFADVLPVFKSQEDWEGGANAWRGAGGPIHIRRPKDPHPTAPAFIEAAREMGMPILDDVNGPMVPGAGYINMNIAADGTRVSAARAFLQAASLKPEAAKAWEDCIESASGGIHERANAPSGFLRIDTASATAAKVHRGQIVVSPAAAHVPKKVPSGLIHDWIGTAFLANTTIKDVVAIIRDYPKYREVYAPHVLESRVISTGETVDLFSIVPMNRSALSKTALDCDYETTFVRVDSRRMYSITQAKRIQEIADYGTAKQHTFHEGEGTGLIWRLYSVSRFEEREDGLYIETEAKWP